MLLILWRSPQFSERKMMKTDIQKADFWKRISAFLFDIVMILVVVIGVAGLMSTVLGYDEHFSVIETVENEYAEKYGINPNITAEEYEALTEEEKDVYRACDKERAKDQRLIIAYDMVINMSFAIVSTSIVIAYLLMEFTVPLFFKNGQTLGKKIFGLAVVHTNAVRIGGQAHFIRSVIGKCTIEVLVPVFLLLMVYFGNLGIVGLAVAVLLAILQLFVICSTKTRSAIHDLISDTVVVDMATQEIFASVDELMAYKNKLHEEMVSRQDY